MFICGWYVGFMKLLAGGAQLFSEALQILQIAQTFFHGELEILANERAIHVALVKLDDGAEAVGLCGYGLGFIHKITGEILFRKLASVAQACAPAGLPLWRGITKIK